MRAIGRAFLAVAVFTLVVSAHEIGHWVGAALVGIPVKEFSVGFGPALWHTMIHGVQFSVRALPLGGFVMPDPEAVRAATPGAVFIMTAAGPVCGLVLTLLVALAFARKTLGNLVSVFLLNAAAIYVLACSPVFTFVRAIRARRAKHTSQEPAVEPDGTGTSAPSSASSSGMMGPIGIMKGFATGNLGFILAVSAAINGLNLSPVPFFDGNRLAMLGLAMIGFSARNAMLLPLLVCGMAIGALLSAKLFK